MTQTMRRITGVLAALLLSLMISPLAADGTVPASASGGHNSGSTSSGREFTARDLGRRATPQVVVSSRRNLLSDNGFGSALVGSAPAGFGSSAVAVDPATKTIYVANGNNANGSPAGGNTVSVIDSRRCNAATVRACAGPWPTVTVGNEPSTLTVDPTTHTVYVTNIDDNTVSVIDGRTCNGGDSSGCGRTPATVPVGSAPIGVFADPATRTVYVGNFGDGTVSIIDSAACNGTHPGGCPAEPPPTIDVGDGPGDVDVNQRTHTAYVTTLTGLTAFDTRTCNGTSRTGCGRTGEFTLCAPDTCIGSFSARVDEARRTTPSTKVTATPR